MLVGSVRGLRIIMIIMCAILLEGGWVDLWVGGAWDSGVRGL